MKCKLGSTNGKLRRKIPVERDVTVGLEKMGPVADVPHPFLIVRQS